MTLYHMGWDEPSKPPDRAPAGADGCAGPRAGSVRREPVGETVAENGARTAGLVAPFSVSTGVGEASYRDFPFPPAMARTRGGVSKAKGSAESDLAMLRREFRSLDRRLREQEERLRALAKVVERSTRRQSVIVDALQLRDEPRRGDRGVIKELQDSVVRLEDYLLKTADRIENILSALKQHRELLVTVNKRVLDVGTKDRIRLELDVMKNTLSILSLNGVEYDASLLKEIETLRERLVKSEDLAQLERAKADLDKKFGDELKKYDLESIWLRKKEIPGYR